MTVLWYTPLTSSSKSGERIERMSKKVKITADSTCDMTPELCEQYDVTIVPLSILLGSQSHEDGIDITRDDIYAYYERTGTTAKTAAVTPNTYFSLFKAYTQDGYDIVHLGFSAKLSSSFQNARIAAGEFDSVYPVDTKSLCTGMALLVIKACKLRDAGLPAKEIAQRIAALRENVHTTFLLNTLEYLSKGGRCSAVTAFGANILGIKPSIEMVDGALEVGKKYRGKIETVYLQYIRDQLASPSTLDLDRVFLSHSGGGVSVETIEAMKRQILQCAPFKEVIVTRAGCTISAHCGPKTATVMYLTK